MIITPAVKCQHFCIPCKCFECAYLQHSMQTKHDAHISIFHENKLKIKIAISHAKGFVLEVIKFIYYF
jgi:hypothetical protein